MKRLATLLTCYNRKAKTLECLNALFQQKDLDKITLDVYLVDDGSTDGTGEAVKEAYPGVKVIQGTGNLFWNGGMRLAFAEAIAQDYEGYLWLNDDTILYPDALRSLLDTAENLAQQGFEQAIVAASTQDPKTQEFTYGGMKQKGWFHPPFKMQEVHPINTPLTCDTICGNFVLIPRNVVAAIGNLDPQLTHYAGDWDYGLRAKQAGCTIWIAPGYQGTCPRNPKPSPESKLELQIGLQKIRQPKGLALQDVTLHPLVEWKVLMQRHGGLFWFIFWLLPYRRLLWNSLRKKT
ncbi:MULTISPECIES: glycosyltransferase family 2 protein [Spirulina sp. CCY15215]|uniref:glycosyltransferase family 2 protein n=1 Tax=Spirulina sp. CCY15215 TaxID=2767591 RepID=UPI001951926D|nr:glycosyltransferase family 2 protein [Spirulina major]